MALQKGTKLSQETREKMSKAKMGHSVSEDTRKKIRNRLQKFGNILSKSIRQQAKVRDDYTCQICG